VIESFFKAFIAIDKKNRVFDIENARVNNTSVNLSSQTEILYQENKDKIQKEIFKDITGGYEYHFCFSHLRFYLEIGTEKSLEFIKLLIEIGEQNRDIFSIEIIQKYVDFKFKRLSFVKQIYLF
jgi:hypothetical protein